MSNHKRQSKAGRRACKMVGVVAFLTLTACAEMIDIGAGCDAYGEARLDMPRGNLPAGTWGGWIADLDDRMTGACRG